MGGGGGVEGCVGVCVSCWVGVFIASFGRLKKKKKKRRAAPQTMHRRSLVDLPWVRCAGVVVFRTGPWNQQIT